MPNCHQCRLNHISRMYLIFRRRQSLKYRGIIAVMLIHEVADISSGCGYHRSKSLSGYVDLFTKGVNIIRVKNLRYV